MGHNKQTCLEQLLTPQEVAATLGLSARTIRRWCQSRRITATRLPNGSWRCKRSVVLDLIETQQTTAICKAERELA